MSGHDRCVTRASTPAAPFRIREYDASARGPQSPLSGAANAQWIAAGHCQPQRRRARGGAVPVARSGAGACRTVAAGAHRLDAILAGDWSHANRGRIRRRCRRAKAGAFLRRSSRQTRTTTAVLGAVVRPCMPCEHAARARSARSPHAQPLVLACFASRMPPVGRRFSRSGPPALASPEHGLEG